VESESRILGYVHTSGIYIAAHHLMPIMYLPARLKMLAFVRLHKVLSIMDGEVVMPPSKGVSVQYVVDGRVVFKIQSARLLYEEKEM